MVFPNTILPVVIELFLNGAWTNLTGLFYSRDPLSVTRGTSGEGGEVERSLCRLTADNRTGNLSPRNPTGIYYGQLGRNTPLRVRLSSGAPPGYLLQHDDGRANTPDSANLSITGDIDVRVDLKAEHWNRAQGLANKATNPSQRSWAFALNADGTLSFLWSTDGSATITKTSTAAVTVPASGRLAVRVTLDVDNGAVGNDVKFYTAPTISGSWTQLGATVTTAGVTSIFDSTANLEIGGSQGLVATDDLTGRLYAFKMYASLNETLLRADVDLSTEEPGPGPFTDATSLVWTLIADASIVRPDIRFSGEVSEWPPRWDKSGTDVHTPIEASGILRRLTQGASPLRSTLYRAYTTLTGANQPKAYWPCEDGDDATRLASALAGGAAMTFTGTPEIAADSTFPSSAPIPTVGTSQWQGTVPTYPATNDVQVWWLMSIPAAGLTNGVIILRVLTDGSIRTWDVSWETGGNLRARGYDNNDTLVTDLGAVAFNANGNPFRMCLNLDQVGSNVEYDLNAQDLNGEVGGLGATATSQNITRATKVIVNPNSVDLAGTAIGHISVHSAIRDPFTFFQEFLAYAGETAGRRVERLCSEEGVTFRGIGDLDGASRMGPQLPATLVDLLRECAAADQGLLYEPRDLFGLAFRPRVDLYAQDGMLALDYNAAQLSEFEPVEDDQTLRNDVTVQRPGGASARAVKQTGVLSVAAPPNGVGRYDEQITLNLETDGLLADAASWRLHLGTVDEARFPTIGVDLARSVFPAGGALALAALDLEMGDRLTVADLPAWLPPDLVSQLAIGFIETMANKTHTIKIVCRPESPWAGIGAYDGGLVRYDSQGSTLAASLTTTATSVSVATPTGPLWTHADGDFNIRVGGEVMTVTAISGAASPQTFTVTRSVNGVVKTHSTGAEVALDPSYVYAL